MVALANFGTVPSWSEAPASVSSSCCTSDSLWGSCCSCCSRRDRRGTASTADSYSDAVAPADVADNFRNCARYTQAPLASQTPSRVDGIAAVPFQTPLSQYLRRTAIDFAVECSD